MIRRVVAISTLVVATACSQTEPSRTPDADSYRSGKFAGAPLADTAIRLGTTDDVAEACTSTLDSFRKQGMATEYVDQDWIDGCVAGVYDRNHGGNYDTSTASTTLPRPSAGQPTRSATPVPGMHTGVTAGRSCANASTYIYGLDRARQVYACHVIAGGQQMLWEGPLGGELVGVRPVDTSCPFVLGGVGPFAQSPDGRPLICTETGWAVGP